MNNEELAKIIKLKLNDCVEHYAIFQGIQKSIYARIEEGEVLEEGIERFWTLTSNAHLEMTYVLWCEVFGTDSNRTHWKKLIPEEERNWFIEEMFNACAVSKDGYARFWNEAKTFRDKYIAHFEEYKEPVPYFQIGLDSIFFMDKEIRKYLPAEFSEGFLQDWYPARLEEICEIIKDYI